MIKKEKKVSNRYFIILILLVLAFLSFGAVKALNEVILNMDGNETIPINFINSTNTNLNEGKNLVYFENYDSAKGLVGRNPQIETISYYDEFSESSVGYVNIFGGIGKDFTIYPGRLYEINTKRQISLNLN